MPLPWKKGKNGSRISRMVADLQSPRRGNSLVVETGFPTSLVDLFVKNRDRLKSQKKTRKKKKKLQQEEQVLVLGEEQGLELERLVISDPVRVTSSRDAGSCTREEVTSGIGDKVSCSKDVDDCLILGGEDSASGARKRGGVLVVEVLRMFLVAAVLGLSTKKMVIGVTVSAFVLIFLECVGRRFSSLCLLVRDCMGLIPRGLGLVPPRFGSMVKREGVVEGGGMGGDGCDLGNDGLGLDSQVEEIKVMDSGFAMIGVVEEDRVKGMVPLDLVGCDERLGEMGVEVERNGVEECREELSRSARIRRKIVKKLVPKRFRRGKKGKMSNEKEENLGDKAFDCFGGERVENIEETQVPAGSRSKLDLENKRKLSLTQLPIEEDEEGDKRNKDTEEDRGVSSFSQELQAEMRMAVVVEPTVGMRSEGKGNSGYVILFLVILAGLIGGRFLAFLLTVGSCVMLKLVVRWRRIS